MTNSIISITDSHSDHLLKDNKITYNLDSTNACVRLFNAVV
jgi:hypothetical protein